MDLMDLGEVAYGAYLASCGGKSIRGEELPSWDDQTPEIREHWRAAADEVAEYLSLRLSQIVESYWLTYVPGSEVAQRRKV